MESRERDIILECENPPCKMRKRDVKLLDAHVEPRREDVLHDNAVLILVIASAPHGGVSPRSCGKARRKKTGAYRQHKLNQG